jgi:poly-beta-1,6-N-acetyl-D-glucosamine synthase
VKVVDATFRRVTMRDAATCVAEASRHHGQVGQLRYVLITAARNEAQYLPALIRSVIAQTVPPLRWIIVSDGSSDATEEIVADSARLVPWIELLSLPLQGKRDFAGKARALNASHAKLSCLEYQVIGCIDADISFEEDHMAFILNKFLANPRLGVAGTPFREAGAIYDYRFSSIEHVSGACQLFRRECFEAIGGYQCLKGGGIDVVAVLTARMLGWETRTFPQRSCTHHRREGGSDGAVWRARFRDGRKDFRLGADPAFELFRCIYQMSRMPAVVGGLAMLLGYAWEAIVVRKRTVSAELVRFRRKEQRRRLRKLFELTPGR